MVKKVAGLSVGLQLMMFAVSVCRSIDEDRSHEAVGSDQQLECALTAKGYCVPRSLLSQI